MTLESSNDKDQIYMGEYRERKSGVPLEFLELEVSDMHLFLLIDIYFY